MRKENGLHEETGGTDRIRTGDLDYIAGPASAAELLFRIDAGTQERDTRIKKEFLPACIPALPTGMWTSGNSGRAALQDAASLNKGALLMAEWRARPDSNRQPSAVLRMCLPKAPLAHIPRPNSGAGFYNCNLPSNCARSMLLSCSWQTESHCSLSSP